MMMTIPTNVTGKTKIDWSKGSCRGLGDTIFFDQSERDENEAREICDSCPIRLACLVYGMTQGFGMWGGLTEKERRQMHMQRKHMTCPDCGNNAVRLTHSNLVGEVCEFCGVSWTVFTPVLLN
jgi:WhiB family redox-sensing transcriptional regulator